MIGLHGVSGRETDYEMAPLTPPSPHRLAAKAALGVRWNYSGTDRSWFKVKNSLKE
jgi:hypothetical protein